LGLNIINLGVQATLLQADGAHVGVRFLDVLVESAQDSIDSSVERFGVGLHGGVQGRLVEWLVSHSGDGGGFSGGDRKKGLWQWWCGRRRGCVVVVVAGWD
jgi:hypothetical protein